MKVLTILLSTCLLSQTGAADRQFAVRAAATDSLRRNRRALTEPMEPGVVCSLANDAGNDTSTETYIIQFYYALGINVETSNSTNQTTWSDLQTFQLQQKLFHAVEQSIPWCYENGVSVNDTKYYGGNRTRRSLQQESVARKLGILSVTVGPTAGSVGSCPNNPQVSDLMNQTGATECQVNEGSIRVIANAGNTINYMTSALLESMEGSINDDKIWINWQEDLEELAFLLYVGATLEEALGPVIVVPPVGGAAGVGTGATRGVLLAVGVPVILLLLLLGFVKSNRNREQVTERELHNMMSSDFVLVGTGDPPASFHEGLYHYMRDGTRYLSTNCEGCLETRRNSFFTDDHLGTIMEDTEFEENVLVTANSKNLGKRASSMDVHRCSSSTCQRCLTAASSGTKFIPARGDIAPHEVVFSEV